MQDTKVLSRKDFWYEIVKEIVSAGRELKSCFDSGMSSVEEKVSFEDFPLAGTYPRELYQEEAHKLGIDIDEVGESEALKRILEYHKELDPNS
jgi:hypothetical protein